MRDLKKKYGLNQIMINMLSLKGSNDINFSHKFSRCNYDMGNVWKMSIYTVNNAEEL